MPDNSSKTTILDPATEAFNAIGKWKRLCREARRKGKRIPLYPSCPYPAGIQRDKWLAMAKMWERS